jgi:hypothetical protein
MQTDSQHITSIYFHFVAPGSQHGPQTATGIPSLSRQAKGIDAMLSHNEVQLLVRQKHPNLPLTATCRLDSDHIGFRCLVSDA